jgi:hypothetical protein
MGAGRAPVSVAIRSPKSCRTCGAVVGRNAPAAYSDDGDRWFRFIVTGLERGEVLEVDDNSVGHDGVGVGAGFRCFAGSA